MANREAKMAKEHRGCFSACRGIYVAYSVKMLVEDVEQRAKCSVPTLSSGKYTCRKKKAFGQLIHLLCTALCEELVFKCSTAAVMHVYSLAAGALLRPAQNWTLQQEDDVRTTSRVQEPQECSFYFTHYYK